MANIVWTNHVLERMRERYIPQGEINNTLNNPDHVSDGKENSKEYSKIIGSKTYTAVVKTGESGQLIVLSAWVDPPNPGTKDFKKNKRYKESQKASSIKKFWFALLDQLGL